MALFDARWFGVAQYLVLGVIGTDFDVFCVGELADPPNNGVSCYPNVGARVFGASVRKWMRSCAVYARAGFADAESGGLLRGVA